MSPNNRILIAEDHTIIRDGVRSLLPSVPGLEIVGEAKNGVEAVQLVESLKPDLVLMDLSMPKMDGMEAIRRIKRVAGRTKILVLTVHKNEEYILATFQAGADGYALKYVSHVDLVSAIETVLAGETYLSPEVFASGGGRVPGRKEEPKAHVAKRCSNPKRDRSTEADRHESQEQGNC